MDAVLIEVRCNLGNDEGQWKGIRNISLEVGYPGLRGQTLWKNIGWIRDRPVSATSSSSHALWNRTIPEHVLVFDFHPYLLPESAEPEKSYCIRRSITYDDGRRRTSKPIVIEEGMYADQFFSCMPQYPTEPEV